MCNINSKWAIFENNDKALNSELIFNSDYKFINVNLHSLVKNTEFYEVQIDTLFNNQILNDGRVSKILYHWDNNTFLDPPIVGICNHNQSKLSISDGRHRTKTAYFIGDKIIPIAVHKNDLPAVEKILM